MALQNNPATSTEPYSPFGWRDEGEGGSHLPALFLALGLMSVPIHTSRFVPELGFSSEVDMTATLDVGSSIEVSMGQYSVHDEVLSALESVANQIVSTNRDLDDDVRAIIFQNRHRLYSV